ncbi:MAG: 50S ribosomal protein L10 [Paludibacteraceae bacterium]|jgi:large subunit ribosomal protein L10|nr:50S ribosomal protein L10 [Paludibacteraceae bacterium]
MKKEDKSAIIAELQETLGQYSHFYLTSIEGLNAEKTSELRRQCFKNDIKLIVAKNTLLKKALEAKGIDAQLFEALKGNTALMLSNTGNAPAKLIKEIVKKEKNKEGVKPELKAAYVEETVYMGAQNLELLSAIKSKNELIADIIALLQSPAKNVVSALQSGGTTIHGVLKTLGERAE